MLGAFGSRGVKVDADIIETCHRTQRLSSCQVIDDTTLTSEACAADVLNPVVGDQEPFLPSHEHSTSIPIAHS